MADLNTGDVDAAMARLPAGITFRSSFFNREGLAGWFEHNVAMDSMFELGDCVTPTGGVTRCEWYRSSEFEPYYPLREKVIYNIRLEDGEPVFVTINHEKADWWEVELQFMSWLAATHPEVGDTLYIRPGDISGGPKFFEPLVAAHLKKQSVALWAESGRP